MTTQTGSIAATTALAPAANPWSLVPPLGNLDAYISAVNRLPLLTSRKSKPMPASCGTTTMWTPLVDW